MKKLILVLLVMAVMVLPVFASQQTTVIDEVQLTKNSLSTTGNAYVGDAKRVSFFVSNDSSLTTEGATCVMGAEISFDGVDWQDMDWYDVAGTTTKQSSESLGNNPGEGDGYYFAWFDDSIVMPVIRFTVTMDSTAAAGLNDAAYNEITLTVVTEN